MAKAKRIVYLIEHLSAGGAEHALVRLATSLDRTLWAPEVWTLVAGGRPLEADLREAGIPVHDLSSLGWNTWTKVNKRALISTAWRLATRRVSIVHSFTYTSFGAEPLAIWSARVPAYIIRLAMEDLHGPQDTWRWKYRAASRIVALTDNMRRRLIEKMPNLAGKTVTIPNGVDSDLFAPRPTKMGVLRRELGLGERDVVFLCAARLHPTKNHAFLITAFARLPRTAERSHLVLAGTGPEEQPLRELAKQAGVADRVHFLGLRRDVPDVMADCDVFVLVSKPGTEGLSNAVLEGMSSGLPVVLSRCGFEEVVEPERQGLLVGADDLEGTTQAMHRLAADAPLRHDMGQRARQRAIFNYSLECTVRANIKMYQDLLAGKSLNRQLTTSGAAFQG